MTPRSPLLLLCLLGAGAACSSTTPPTSVEAKPERPGPTSSRLENARNLALRRAAYQSSSADYDHTAHLVTDGVTVRAGTRMDSTLDSTTTVDADGLLSAWTSGVGDPQWLYVDLGAPALFDRVKLYWDVAHATAYRLDVSADAEHWTTAYETAASDGGIDELLLAPTTARYVRVYGLHGAATAGYSLLELEVYGQGGATPSTHPAPAPVTDGVQSLSGGGWRIERAARVRATGEQLSQSSFDDGAWLPAVVPGTVLANYLEAGAVPDPNFGDQGLQISDAFFTADFWYRTTFAVPRSYCGKRTFLHFDGINWKADVFVDGQRLGDIRGAFTRGVFDVSEVARCGESHGLAVLVHRNDNPGNVKTKTLASTGPNGGILGADNPTVHASIGWDWTPTVRGRDTGIQDDVYLSSSGDVAILDPFVSTSLPLPSVARAELTVTTDLENHASHAVDGVLSGVIDPGQVRFSQPVHLDGAERKTITLRSRGTPALVIQRPRLWWPNGYGAQHLYRLGLTFDVSGIQSDSSITKFGIRQVTSRTSEGALSLSVNGRRIAVKGGNWGMSDSMLRLDREGYDVRVRLHQEQHFNMIRNWIGMTSRDAFYDACDEHGLLIWDDFWLANSSDGPEPDDPKLFMDNARDKIRRVRRHPSLALYCGRNEAEPPESLGPHLEAAVKELDGTRPYLSNSAAGSVGGGGPYDVRDPVWYFEHSDAKIHSEVGMPCVPSAESMRRMMPARALWPIGETWGAHDFCGGAQKAPTYTAAIERSYGAATSLDDYTSKAQFVNLENYKALFEGYASHHRNGVLLWMSLPAWPTTVWQTFDYYLEPTGAYFGAKRAAEPLHVLWDASTNAVKVVNASNDSHRRLTVDARVFDLDGATRYTHSAVVDSTADTVVTAFPIVFPSGLSATHFVSLRLLDGRNLLSDNFYWRGTEYQNYRALTTMAKARVTALASLATVGSTNTLTVTVTNDTAQVALMLRLTLLRSGSRERVLPVYYEDNYFSLTPGESRRIALEFDSKYLAGEAPALTVQGWNVDRSAVAVSR